jgi:hypothetical protein
MAVTGGCVHAGASDVKVNTVDAELVFGVKVPAESAPSPVEAAVMPEQQIAQPLRQPPPLFRNNVFDIPLYVGGVVNEDEIVGCPSEIRKPLPRRNANAEVDGEPLVGALQFNGTYVVNQGADPPVTPLEPETRVLRHYVKNAHKSFTYEVVQPYGKYFLVSTFLVKPQSTGQSAKPATEPVIESPRARSDPEAGLVLKRTEVVDANGKRAPGTTPFAPATGVLLIPFPVSSEDYSSSAVDPNTGRTFRLTASVKARDRINACGEPVVGWVVQTYVSISDGNNANDAYEWHYLVAPQYGAMIIAEKIMRPKQDASPVQQARPADTTIRSIAGVEPTAPPPGYPK